MTRVVEVWVHCCRDTVDMGMAGLLIKRVVGSTAPTLQFSCLLGDVYERFFSHKPANRLLQNNPGPC